ncbi:hypothetical protein [Estrella lausannensis]|uniref:Putative secreted protein n=1 Tax=Estrella lausannensis TaxID=483423 RepID=A0A0H5DRI9_9BACT|nr:hypothetical protein [Estrella lausannensis]CRX39207.1 putative secreted protein [Estrella lausannensis]
MKIILFLFTVCCSLLLSCAEPAAEAQTVFEYLLFEIEQDAVLSTEERLEKIKEFKLRIGSLPKNEASWLTRLLLQETRSRITDILKHASLEEAEIETHLAEYEQTTQNVHFMTPELARQRLFFVADLKIHRQYVYEFGIALGCEERQLLRHDLCKLSAKHFEGGWEDEERLTYLAARGEHQNEEAYHDSFGLNCDDFDSFSEESLRTTALESVADWLAVTKQRGGSTISCSLISNFTKNNPHPRLIPFLKEALIKAHVHYLDSKQNPDTANIFANLPCWSKEVEEFFESLK